MAFDLLILGALAAATPVEPPAPPEPKVADSSLDKLVCKRIKRTGSLVASSRLCMTRREWNRSAAITREEWGALQGIQGNSRGN